MEALLGGRSRREALKQGGSAGLAFLAAGALARLAEAAADEEVVPFTDVPAEFTTRRGDGPFRLDLRELRSFITAVDDFFGVQHYNRPSLDPAAWRLRVGGLASRPFELTLADLKKRRRTLRTVTFECSGNQKSRHHGMIGTATWAGPRLRDLLKEAEPRPEVEEVVFWAADKGKETIRGEEYEQNFARSMSLADALAAEAIVAYEMNGAPLNDAHGAPARLLVPGWYGIANVKWLERIELSDRRLMNRFMGRDYVTIIGREAFGRTEFFERSVTRQRVKSVIARVTRSGERFIVFGAAWTDGTPLRTVEVRLDGGAWQRATLAKNDNPFAWTFFTLETANLAPGPHELVSRATDAKGRVQPEALPLKKTYWEDNAQFARTIEV
jgi:DMSO/TMAO reductase YedYZ molybdopterin-dependent catalytic subunit